jgi:hypothetical protein
MLAESYIFEMGFDVRMEICKENSFILIPCALLRAVLEPSNLPGNDQVFSEDAGY